MLRSSMPDPIIGRLITHVGDPIIDSTVSSKLSEYARERLSASIGDESARMLSLLRLMYWKIT